MQELLELNLVSRTVKGTGASRRLRHEDIVPAVVYKQVNDSEMYQMSHNSLIQVLNKNYGSVPLVKVSLNGKATKIAVIKDVQIHPHKRKVLHIDFQTVEDETVITLASPVKILNEDNCVGIRLEGGVLTQQLAEVVITGKVKDIPANIEIDVKELQSGKSVKFSQLNLAEGIQIPQLEKGTDSNIVSVVARRGGTEELEGEEGTESEASSEEASE